MKRIFNAVIGSISLFGSLLAAVPAMASAAAAPSLYFSSDSLTVNQGSNFSLALQLNPNGTAVNALNVVVNYPQNELTFVNLDKAGSAFNTFVPATPTAQNGSVTFAAATLGSASTTSVSLVGTLNFTAKAGADVAAIDLNGSQAADGGPAIHVATTGASVSLAAASGNSASAGAIGISDIDYSGVSTSGGTITWKTSVPTTGVVDFGVTNSYGLTASSDTLATAHSLNLGQRFSGRTTVHFRITATDSAANTQVSSDQTFRTLGYTVHISLTKGHGTPLGGKKLSISGGKAATTDSNGVATLSDVPPGTQQVAISGDKSQFISVKALVGTDAEKPQDVQLTASAGAPAGLYIGIALVVVILAIALFATWWQTNQQHEPASK